MDEASDKSAEQVSRIFPEARRSESEDELRTIVETHKQWLEGKKSKKGKKASLERADLTAAKLQGANLSSAILQGADFDGAKFQGAILDGANLQDADLIGANLSGADLRYSKRGTLTQLDQACGDTKTKLPDHLTDYKMRPCYSQSLKRSEESD